MRFLVRAFLLLLGLAIAGAGFGAWAVFSSFDAPGPPAAFGTMETVVLLPRGTGLNRIAETLEGAGVVDNSLVFSAGVVLSRKSGQLKAGEYAIPSGASPRQIMEILIEGKSIQHKLTLPEGLTTAMALALVMKHPSLAGEITRTPEEGGLLPETYSFNRGMLRDELIERMERDHDAVLEELWPGRAADLPIATKEEAVILASIVEKETGVASERPLVAGVFINRLRRGMKLQSDPTIIYGLTKGVPLGRGIRRSEIEKATPYNTYVINGLPPTPIANPGRDSIAAVLNPAQTDALFFVADGTGGHVFAATLADHERNVENWRRIERERASVAADGSTGAP